MRGLWSNNQRLRVGFMALAMLLIIFAAPLTVGALAEDVPGGPDTAVSSDGSMPVAQAPAQGGSPEPYQVSAGSAGEESSKGSSQVKKRAPVSHEQETKDRLFVEATFIAVAIILCVIAVFLFVSLPKQAKKTSSDGQEL